MRNKVSDIYQSGKAYWSISKALGLQRTTVRTIIHTWNIEEPSQKRSVYHDFSKHVDDYGDKNGLHWRAPGPEPLLTRHQSVRQSSSIPLLQIHNSTESKTRNTNMLKGNLKH
ncbi:hypothetical protein CHARACLAT_031917 [Characodon lateralis]|uniref:Uncharacterized protein n=1 Tax=Characodon lateralis TaxID=208331 RepID=A0ABU7E9F9_9TELE|nr:hypothetical protein [Characodon lateralis]